MQCISVGRRDEKKIRIGRRRAKSGKNQFFVSEKSASRLKVRCENAIFGKLEVMVMALLKTFGRLVFDVLLFGIYFLQVWVFGENSCLGDRDENAFWSDTKCHLHLC